MTQAQLKQGSKTSNSDIQIIIRRRRVKLVPISNFDRRNKHPNPSNSEKMKNYQQII